MSLDLCIIGGGLAGALAALSAAQHGARVVLVHHAPGATAMHTGVFDVDAAPARIKKIEIPENNDFSANIQDTLIANPHHPYARLGDNIPGVMRDALEFAAARLALAGLPLAGSTDQWMLLATQLGTLRRVRLCLQTMAAGDISQMKNANLLVIGPRGLDGFRPAAAAATIKHLADRVSPGLIGRSAGALIDAPVASHTPNLAPYHFAPLMDSADSRDEFFEHAAQAVKEHAATHVAFPAVMGVHDPAAVIDAASHRLGAPCFELAAAPPSVPGQRLENALARALRKADIPVVRARATGFSAGDKDVFSISVQTPLGDTQDIQASAFVLASGKFTAGGLARQDALVESLFDLPVFYNGWPARDTFMYDLVTPSFADSQPIFSCGLMLDFRLRPADQQGRRVWRNLFAAGSVLGGYDPFQDRCGSGVAMATAFAAGRAAAESAMGEQR